MCLAWLTRIIRLLNTDEYPIQMVQFDFPCCPSVLYNLDTLDNHMPAIYDMFMLQLSIWSTRPPSLKIPPQPPIPFEDDSALNTAFIQEEGEAAGRHANQNKGRHHLFFDDLA
jgi:hypothetical protein